MGLIVFLIIVYNLFIKTNPKLKEKTKGRIPLFVVFFGLLQIIGVFGGVISSAIGNLLALGFIASPFIVIGWIIKKMKGIGDKKVSEEYQDIKKELGEDIKLTESVSKRRKIVAKFNEKYSLCLTEQQIDRIVEASYSSYSWQREVYDMSKDYSSHDKLKDYKFASQWIDDANSWLRAYLYVFPVMDISSDIKYQEQIVEDTYYAIFKDIDPKNCYSIEDCIKKINDKYMTRFDDKTFMEAYRFLQKHHHNFKLPGADRNILRNESEVEKLAEKYDAFKSKRQKEAVDREYSKETQTAGQYGAAGESSTQDYGNNDITPEELEEMIRSGKLNDDEIKKIIKQIYGDGEDEEENKSIYI